MDRSFAPRSAHLLAAVAGSGYTAVDAAVFGIAVAPTSDDSLSPPFLLPLPLLLLLSFNRSRTLSASAKCFFLIPPFIILISFYYAFFVYP